MLLAGGQGTRLYSLTKNVAKPAVSFGGKYRIIDFPLSNCINSGIDTIGVLTQYQPFALNQYIGNGQPWDLDRLNGGVFVLPPYMKAKNSDWYKGTANAIYQNIEFIDKFSPEYVLVLSGDHIYKMDYADMLASHKRRGADCTIAVINVTLEEASRFGIMNTKEDGEIYEFEEKPKKPKSTNASMGIYIFTWEKLRRYLIEDEADKTSSNDFGKNIIPAMLKDGCKLYAYNFSGYWKDVGTINSLWEANMDLLDEDSGLNLDDDNHKIYARNSAEPPHYTGADAVMSIMKWRDSAQIAHLAKLVAVTRPGYAPPEEMKRVLRERTGFQVSFLEMTGLDVSSSDLRRRVADGRSIRYLTKEVVFRYIEEHGLYRNDKEGERAWS